MNVEVEVKWTYPTKIKFGVIKGLNLWSPADKPDLKYPYLAYDWSPFSCINWYYNNICDHHIGSIPEKEYLYFYQKRRYTLRLTRIAIGRVLHGASYETPDHWAAKNVEEVIDDTKVTLNAPRLVMEAVKRGWQISRSSRTENLLAVWAVTEGIIPDTPIKLAPALGLVSSAEKLTVLNRRPILDRLRNTFPPYK